MSKTATHRKYVREVIAKADLSQACFTVQGDLEKMRAVIFRENTGCDLTKVVLCPFCLLEGPLQKFLVSTKKGISAARGRCPHCENGMMLRTLTHDWTVPEYAKWVYQYSGSGFWQKIPSFEVWKERLRQRGWSTEFWDTYKQLKEESPREENVETRMNRLGEEAAQQWNTEQPGGDVDA